MTSADSLPANHLSTHHSHDPARVLLFSMRNIDRHVARCAGYEFEDTICAADGVDLVAHVSVQPYRDSLWPTRYLMRGLGRDERLVNTDPPANQEYDLFFTFCLRPWDLRYVQRLPGLRDRCRQSACVIGEVWPSQVAELGAYLSVLKEFDYIFTNVQSSVEAIQEWAGRPCRYLPPGVDALRFCPFPDSPPRNIDVYSMGRRIEEEHRVLVACADRGKMFYVYDTVSDFNVTDPREHRALVANLVKRSRYFIAYPAKFTEGAETGGQYELGPRFFEGAAGGAVMIGMPPHSPAYDSCFDWPDAVIPTSSDRSQIAGLVAELEAQQERMQRIRRNNVLHSLQRHDWAYRWCNVLDCLGLPKTTAMAARKERLASVARAVDTGAET